MRIFLITLMMIHYNINAFEEKIRVVNVKPQFNRNGYELEITCRYPDQTFSVPSKAINNLRIISKIKQDDSWKDTNFFIEVTSSNLKLHVPKKQMIFKNITSCPTLSLKLIKT